MNSYYGKWSYSCLYPMVFYMHMQEYTHSLYPHGRDFSVDKPSTFIDRRHRGSILYRQRLTADWVSTHIFWWVSTHILITMPYMLRLLLWPTVTTIPDVDELIILHANSYGANNVHLGWSSQSYTTNYRSSTSHSKEWFDPFIFVVVVVGMVDGDGFASCCWLPYDFNEATICKVIHVLHSKLQEYRLCRWIDSIQWLGVKTLQIVAPL
jgi:hypothetical protein